MAILQGNTYQLPVQIIDAKGDVVPSSAVEKGQFVFGDIEKFYGGDGEVWWNEEQQSFMIPLTEDETFKCKGVVNYQARVLLKDGSISGTIPRGEYVYDSITSLRLSEGGAGVQGGSIVKANLLKEVATVISDITVDSELSKESENPVQNKVITNELEKIGSIAKGASKAVSYTSYQEAVSKINALESDKFNVGQNIMIYTLAVPDLWVSGVEETNQQYTYVNDNAIVDLLKSQGFVRVGHYTLSALETGKVDLENYYTKTETEGLLENLAKGVEHIVGTADKPINVANDLQSGNLYVLSGHIVLSSTVTDEVETPILTLKSSNSNIVFYGAYRFGNYLAPRPYSTSVCAITSNGSINVLHQATGIKSLNGTSNWHSPPSIYTPTTGGTAGQILQSSGSGEPTWIDMPEAGVPMLVGTKDKPINLATDMEVGHLYSVSGRLVSTSSTMTITLPRPVLFFKYSTSHVIAYSAKLAYYLAGADCGLEYITDVYFNSSTGYLVDTASKSFATLDDITNAIGNVSSLLGDTSDLEV